MQVTTTREELIADLYYKIRWAKRYYDNGFLLESDLANKVIESAANSEDKSEEEIVGLISSLEAVIRNNTHTIQP